VARLDVQARSHERLAELLWERERLQRKSPRGRSSRPDPRLLQRELDQAAYAMVYQADRLSSEPNLQLAAADFYQQVVSDFPESSWRPLPASASPVFTIERKADMSRSKVLWLLLLLIGAVSAAPANRGRMSSIDPNDSNLVGTIKLTYRSAHHPTDDREMLRVLGNVSDRIYQNDQWSGQGAWGLRAGKGDVGTSVVGFDDPQFRIYVSENKDNVMLVRLHAGLPRPRAVLEALPAALKTAVSSAASIPDDQIPQRLAQAEQELSHVHQLQEQIAHLTASRQKVREEILADKLKALELEKLRLEMDLAAKKARGAALREQMQKIVRTATTRDTSSDAVLAQLAKSVALRQQQLEQNRERYKQGMMSSTEVAESEEALLSAKARLAQREQELSQPADLELLTRLTQEVTLVAVDTAELAERLQQVIQRLPPDNLLEITEKDLARLTAEYSASETPDGKPIPLRVELQKRQNDIELRMLALRLSDVSWTPAPPTQPASP
jgi:hypothetical protein